MVDTFGLVLSILGTSRHEARERFILEGQCALQDTQKLFCSLFCRRHCSSGVKDCRSQSRTEIVSTVLSLTGTQAKGHYNKYQRNLLTVVTEVGVPVGRKGWIERRLEGLEILCLWQYLSDETERPPVKTSRMDLVQTPDTTTVKWFDLWLERGVKGTEDSQPSDTGEERTPVLVVLLFGGINEEFV